jgi:hypothetical protein
MQVIHFKLHFKDKIKLREGDLAIPKRNKKSIR